MSNKFVYKIIKNISINYKSFKTFVVGQSPAKELQQQKTMKGGDPPANAQFHPPSDGFVLHKRTYGIILHIFD
jgi:hypothetical protein